MGRRHDSAGTATTRDASIPLGGGEERCMSWTPLLVCSLSMVWEKQWRMSQVGGSLPPTRETQLKLLVSAWLSSGHRGVFCHSLNKRHFKKRKQKVGPTRHGGRSTPRGGQQQTCGCSHGHASQSKQKEKEKSRDRHCLGNASVPSASPHPDRARRRQLLGGGTCQHNCTSLPEDVGTVDRLTWSSSQ